MSTWDANNDHVLALVRRIEGRVLVCLFNFSDAAQQVRLDGLEGSFTDLITKEKQTSWLLQPYQYAIQIQEQG